MALQKMSKPKTILLMLFLFLLALWALTWVMGCKVLKHKTSQTSDSTAVHKQLTTSVSKEESTSKLNSEWWRETFTYPGRVDTMQQKVLQPVNNFYTQPVQYIREGGTLQQETKHFNYDSFAQAVQDSVKAILSRTEKTKEVQVLNWWQTLLVGAAGGLVIVLFSKFKISKR